MSDNPPRSSAHSVQHVMQGEFAVSADPDTVLSTLLGSCVAACLYDPSAKLGGMNHFLLPETGSDDTRARLYGAHLMELLVNELLHLGARKERLVAKLFGGAKVVSGLSRIGDANVAFAQRFFMDEEIPLIAENVGGRRGLHLRFHPATGVARTRPIAKIESLPPIRAAEPKEPRNGQVELF
ncbi:MAG: chemotaxis protein CheD [Pikeienuella sp.]|uniref:chemotaxis protein CheD n=1 Tax=Pikeienuella sp. TaxID=2831957 RepID=UPI00391DA803